MTSILRFLAMALLVPVLLTGCDLEEPTPVDPSQSPVYLTKVSTSQGDERQFVYNGQGWLTQIIGKGSFSLNGSQTSTSNVLFDNWRRIAYVITDESGKDAENVYHYTSEHMLYKLEELVDGTVERYHTFEYDANRLLNTRYSFSKDATVTDAPRATNKLVYTYDASGNVTEIASYHKPNLTSDWQLTQTQKFTDYDSKTGVQHMTDSLFTPTIVLQRNNPGKITTLLASGEQRVTVYTYLYNERNLPVKRTTSPSQGEIEETTFTYQF
jgi:hypothetical protein